MTSSRALIVAGMAGLFSGCAVTVHDKSSGEQRIYGCGLISSRTDSVGGDGLVAVQVETAGISIGSVLEEHLFSIGWQKVSRVTVPNSETSTAVKWPMGDVYGIQSLSEWPTKELTVPLPE